MEKPVLSIKGLAIGYNSNVLVHRIDLDVLPGEIISVIGANGSGKTTLLKTLLGIIRPLGGSIMINCINNPKPHQIKGYIGYVPQVNTFERGFPLKVGDVIMMGYYPSLSFYKKITNEMKKKAFDFAEKFNISDLLDKPLGILSEGQKQKVSIIRALVPAPRLLLLDEPFSATDIKSTEDISEIIKVVSKQGIAVIIVNHNIQMITEYVDRVVCLGKNVFIHGKPKEILDGELLKCLYGKNLMFLHHNDIPHMVLKKH